MTKRLDSLKRYVEQRDNLRKRFEAEKTGDQTAHLEKVKLFNPIIESQKETSKAIQDKIVAGQESTSNVLVPFVRELEKRNDQVESFQNLPFYNNPLGIEDISHSTPLKEHEVIKVDLDGELLDQTHLENLQDMGLDLPSDVQKKGTYEEAWKLITSQAISIGKCLGDKSKKPDKEKEVSKSREGTLNIYREKIKGLKGAKQFLKKSGKGLQKRKLCKLIRGRGRPRKYPDTIVYSTPDELCEKLNELCIAKESGNTGLDNSIVSILDELLDKKWINKDDYDKMFKNIIKS